jgi:hypothetical protein
MKQQGLPMSSHARRPSPKDIANNKETTSIWPWVLTHESEQNITTEKKMIETPNLMARYDPEETRLEVVQHHPPAPKTSCGEGALGRVASRSWLTLLIVLALDFLDRTSMLCCMLDSARWAWA